MKRPSGAPEEKPARVRGAGNLALRVVSAIVLGVAVLALAYAGGLAFRLLAAAMGATIFYEWVTMPRQPVSRFHLGFAAVLLLIVLGAMVAGVPVLLAFALVCICLAACWLHAAVGGHGHWVVAGLAYASLPAYALALLRGDDRAGLVALLFLFAVVWATDTVAYFVGRAVGGPKLAPAISPGKTVSGAVGGAAGAVAAGVAVVAYAMPDVGLVAVGAIAFVLSAISQLGDLLESAAKRRHGVKDSGRLIPGHGGVMDRVDGLVAAAVALYFIGVLLSGPDMPAAGFLRL